MNYFPIILNSAARDDENSAEALLPLVYNELRRMAYAQLSSRISSHTLQPTALVHEAWLKMVDNTASQAWQSRGYFLAAASNTMRQILIDHARKKNSIKRGGQHERVNLEQVDLSHPEPDEVLLSVEAALEHLEQIHPLWAKVVEAALEHLEQIHPLWAKVVVMKYFGGLTNEETAEALNIGQSSVDRYWACAKAWLYKVMSERAA